MKKLLYLIPVFLLMVCATTSLAQPVNTAPKPAPAVKKMVDVSKVDAFIQEHVDKGIIPGGTFYAAYKGEVIYHKSFGDKVPGMGYTNSDIYRMASMTKAVTSTAILQLYERGKLKLDDPVEKYIPAFANPVVLDKLNPVDSSYTTKPATRSITIRHLLTHTAGIYYGSFATGDLRAAYMKNGIDQFGLAIPGITTLQIANMIAKAPLAHNPGEKWTYGLNMDVLGAVVEVVSGQQLDEYFEENIFKPVGMMNTGFHIGKEKHRNIVPVYTYNEEGKMIIDENELLMYPAGPDEGGYFGGGGLSGTAEDYGMFVQMLLDKGKAKGGQVLSRHTAELMTTDQIGHLNLQGAGMSPIPGMSFCLGSGLVNDMGAGIGPHKPGSYFWGGVFNSKWWVDQEEELVFVGMTNILPFPHDDFWDRLYPVLYAGLD